MNSGVSREDELFDMGIAAWEQDPYSGHITSRSNSYASGYRKGYLDGEAKAKEAHAKKMEEEDGRTWIHFETGDMLIDMGVNDIIDKIYAACTSIRVGTSMPESSLVFVKLPVVCEDGKIKEQYINARFILSICSGGENREG